MEDYTIFLDEAGDHTLEIVDKDFPVFVLVALIIENNHYITEVMPKINQLKYDFFGSEGVILHSSHIRKCKEDFSILMNVQVREKFYDTLNGIMKNSKYSIIASAIKKQVHKDKYGINATNPYDLSLKFILERLIHFCQKHKLKKAHLIAESRGKREDDELKLAFYRTISEGTGFIESSKFKNIDFKIELRSKNKNIIGHQMADLVAYPIARKVLHPEAENKPYDIIKDKLYGGNYNEPNKYGLKIFP